MPPSVRSNVRERAGKACEYCRLPDQHDRLPFQVDHIIPRKHGGATALANLAWSCFDCNVYRGANLAGIDPESAQPVRLFNPRVDNWSEHFQWAGPELHGQTAIGRATAEVLRINLPIRVEHRRLLIAAGFFVPA